MAVLDDLNRIFPWIRQPFNCQENPQTMALREGARGVLLHIQDRLTTPDPDEVKRIEQMEDQPTIEDRFPPVPL